MISVLVSFRNSRQSAINCLQSLLYSFAALKISDVEFILIDDSSKGEEKLPELFEAFRSQVPAGAKVKQFLFNEQQHYTRALAFGFSAAKGKNVLFVSHDMFVTPPYIRTLLAVAESDQMIGLVRGVSPYVDGFPQHCVTPPFPMRSLQDLDVFAQYVAAYWKNAFVEDRLLTGDSMLIKREVFDKIGVFDSRYFGYFGDVDFGLRLLRAGFKMVCAKGAWLLHEGAAAYKDEASKSKEDYAIIHHRRMMVVNEAYKVFRDKWDRSLPEDYPGGDTIPHEALRHVAAPAGGEFEPLVYPDPSKCTIIE